MRRQNNLLQAADSITVGQKPQQRQGLNTLPSAVITVPLLWPGSKPGPRESEVKQNLSSEQALSLVGVAVW